MKKLSFRELCGLHKDSQLIKQKQHLNPDLLTWKFRAFVVTRTYTYQRTCHLAWEDSLRAVCLSPYMLRHTYSVQKYFQLFSVIIIALVPLLPLDPNAFP